MSDLLSLHVFPGKHVKKVSHSRTHSVGLLFFSTPLPHLRESKTVLDCGFHIVRSGFQVLDSYVKTVTKNIIALFIIYPLVQRSSYKRQAIYPL